MKIHDKVSLKTNLNTVHMFPPKYQLPHQIDVTKNTQGYIEEVYASGNGIVNFNGHRVLVFDLENKLELI